MDEIEAAVLEAFAQVYPGLLENPQELKRRLLRRRRDVLIRPPRAACLCLRAEDRRLWESFPVTRPRGAPVPAGGENVLPYEEREARDFVPHVHEITVTWSLLARLCEPVRFQGAVSARRAAEMLGVTEHAVLMAASEAPTWRHAFRKVDARGEAGILPWDTHGMAEARRKGWKDLAGPEAKQYVRGRRRVVVVPQPDPRRMFDPSARRLSLRVDAGFGNLYESNLGRVPGDFEQRVVRRRVFQRGGRQRAGQVQPNGWAFECPACGSRARVLYLPTRLWALTDFLGVHPEREIPGLGEPCDRLVSAMRLGCGRCHGVDHARVGKTQNGWNRFVSHVTAGLLFGRDVPMPEFLRVHQAMHRARSGGRKQAAPKREELLRRCAAGEAYAEIATEMGIKVRSVREIWSKFGRRKGMERGKAPRAAGEVLSGC